jgi:hypothetical protein
MPAGFLTSDRGTSRHDKPEQKAEPMARRRRRAKAEAESEPEPKEPEPAA